VYYGSPAGLRAAPGWRVFSSYPDELVAASAGPAGDIDGDGLSDLIVGAPTSLKDFFERVRLFLGAPTGLSRAANWTAEGDQAGSAFGASVSAAGDVNGDGCADVLVGAPDYSNGQTGEGRVFIYSGSSLRAELRPNYFAYLPVLGK
jgi:hypothetical protein